MFSYTLLHSTCGKNAPTFFQFLTESSSFPKTDVSFFTQHFLQFAFCLYFLCYLTHFYQMRNDKLLPTFCSFSSLWLRKTKFITTRRRKKTKKIFKWEKRRIIRYAQFSRFQNGEYFSLWTILFILIFLLNEILQNGEGAHQGPRFCYTERNYQNCSIGNEKLWKVCLYLSAHYMYHANG